MTDERWMAQRVENLNAEVQRLTAENARLRRTYGADSPNGDVLDWVADLLDNPNDGASKSALRMYVARRNALRLA